MIKEQGSEARGREIKSRRERELEELRSRGVAKTRRDKLKHHRTPLQTALESKQFLLACHDQSKKEHTFGQPKWNPSTVSAVDYNSFLMQQSKRQRELKMKRREAEQLLHGFKGFYGESFASWSPRHARSNSRGSAFAFGAEDTLRDPDDDSRRQTTFSSAGSVWSDAEGRDDSSHRYRYKTPQPLDPHITDFLIDDRHYDGTKYPRTDQDMDVSNGVVMFSPRADDNQYRERPPSTSRSSASKKKRFFDNPNNYAGSVYDESQDGNENDFAVGFDDNEFRERPPSTAQSSNSAQKDFFTSPTSAHSRGEWNMGGRQHRGSISPYEPRRMRLHSPAGSSIGKTNVTPDGFPAGGQASGHSRQHSEGLPDDFQEGSDEKALSGRGQRSGKVRDHCPDRVRAQFSGKSSQASEHSERRHDDFEEERFDDEDWRQDPRSSEDPEGRDPNSYRERRMQLQINTERDEVIDTTGSEERLRQAEDENSSRRGDRQGIFNNTSGEGSTASPTLRAGRQPVERVPPAIQEVAIPEPKAPPVPETIWRDFISDEPGAKFPPEAGRYHLYASYACPGSHRALIVRALKGLEHAISITIVHPTWRHTNPENPKDKHRGWIFGDPDGKPFHNTMGRGGPFPPAYPGNDPDPVLNAFSVRNLYEFAKDTSGKYTIPLLWDTKLNTIVNNESSDISYMLNSCFNKFAEKPDLDLYTEDDEDGLDRLNEVSQWLYPMMIHGVYRCGFAKTQRAYDIAIEELTVAFDAADKLLQQQRYLTGDTLTDADIRFFVTLIRFDEVYAFYFRANTRLVLMTPSLLNFCREIYQMPGVASTCHMDQIKAHFFGSHAEWNKYSVVPRGLGFMRYLEMPHDRQKLAGLGHI